jgi:hypothetical protein
MILNGGTDCPPDRAESPYRGAGGGMMFGE